VLRSHYYRFGDLSANYVNDRILKLIKEVNFDRMNKTYQEERINLEDSEPPLTPTTGSIGSGAGTQPHEDLCTVTQHDPLPLLDSFPNSSGNKIKGLLFLMDDGKEPSRFLEKFESEFYGEPQYRHLYSVDFRNTSLTICHANGTRIVEYDVKKILQHSDIASASKFTSLLVQESQKLVQFYFSVAIY